MWINSYISQNFAHSNNVHIFLNHDSLLSLPVQETVEGVQKITTSFMVALTLRCLALPSHFH